MSDLELPTGRRSTYIMCMLESPPPEHQRENRRASVTYRLAPLTATRNRRDGPPRAGEQRAQARGKRLRTQAEAHLRAEQRPPTSLGVSDELIPFVELQRLDRLLAALGRGAGALRLRLGEALELLGVRGWHHELGFSSVGAYALERCERGPRWAAESRVVARRLAKLPLLRHALISGVVGWSMVELLARRAAPETERALLEDSTTLTVRALRARFGEQREPHEADRRMLTVTVDQTDAWLFECTRHLVSHLVPGSTQDDVVHALLAEATSTLAERLPAGMLVALAQTQPDDAEVRAAWRAQRAAWSEEAEARCESRVDLSTDSRTEQYREPTTVVSSPQMLDDRLRKLSAELADRDLLLGILAERFWRADGWRRLGYASSVQYARERLGLSLSSIKSRRVLALRGKHLPPLAKAVQSSRVGYEAALILSRIANRQTVEAWIDRASERTVKQLREEVQVAELFVRLGRGRSQLPPDETTMRHVSDARLEATKHLSELAKPQRPRAASVGQMSADILEPAEAANVKVRFERRDAPVGSERGWGRATLRLGMKPDTLAFWHSMAKVHQCFQGRLGGSLIEFLCLSFWEVWGRAFDGSGAYGHIYARDGYRCTNPTCSRRDVTPHHLRFRSRGGGDEAENVTSLCVWCHLEGVHGGRIKAKPPAPDIDWQLGRKPILVVRGRKKSDQGMSPSRHSMGGCSGAATSS